MSAPRLLTYAEAAKTYGMSKRQVDRFCADGTWETVRITESPRSRRVVVESVERWLEERREQERCA